MISVKINQRCPSDALFNANLKLFQKRFPQLYAMHSEKIDRARQLIASDNFFSSLNIQVFAAKSGGVSAKENGALLHSAYDPAKEAEKLLDAQIGEALKSKNANPAPFAPRGITADSGESFSFAFYGFGLGYLPAAAAKKFPAAQLILVEPDFLRFLLALALLDWSAVFAAARCVLLLEADTHTAAGVMESLAGETAVIFGFAPRKENQPLGEISAPPRAEYFANLTRLVNLHQQQKNANALTLASFGFLWLKNSARNLGMLAQCRGVNELRGAARGMDALIIAAGPSLDAVVPHLARLKERCVIIAVNTALRACLDAGTQPDFIVLTDPQYWAAGHIAGLEAPQSILVTEIAAYPSVFRFKCAEIILFDSIYPVGAFFSARGKNAAALSKGKLASGGSVATAAWDLARLLGAQNIFFAALDLGYPQGKTHARGSLFEEACHARSRRDCPAQTQYVSALFAARRIDAKDYEGNALASDERMTLYAWWFENEFAKDAAAGNSAPSSITAHSRALKGTRWTPMEHLLALPVAARRQFAPAIAGGVAGAQSKRRPAPAEGVADNRAKEQSEGWERRGSSAAASRRRVPPAYPDDETAQKIAAVKDALAELQAGLLLVRKNAREALAVCDDALDEGGAALDGALAKLATLDGAMKAGGLQNIVALVFPPHEKLREELAALAKERAAQDARCASLLRSAAIYAHIERAASLCIEKFSRACLPGLM